MANPATLLINNPTLEKPLWQKQHLFEFTQRGLPEEFKTFLDLNSTNYTVPFSTWINEGDIIEFTFQDSIPKDFISHYVLHLNQSSLSSFSPNLITANYHLQYNLNFLVIIALIIIGICAFAVLQLKRRNKI
jgi:hypothetical protein